MPLTTHDRALNLSGVPAFGTAISSVGTSLFVLNTDLKVLTNTTTASQRDPWSVIDGTATNHAVVRPVAVPNAYSYMDIYIATDSVQEWVGFADVHAFGRVPRRVAGQGRQWPFDDDSTNFTDVADMWVPLVDTETNSTTVVLDTNQVGARNIAGTWKIGGGRSIFLAGCEEVLLTCSTVIGAGGGNTVAMAVGRFTG